MNVTRNNFPPPPKVPSPSSTPFHGRRSLSDEYMRRLVQDFNEETADLPVEELIRRNAERQKVLKSALEKESGNGDEKKKQEKYENDDTTGPNGVYIANPIPPPSVATPIMGAGAPPFNQQKNLRYIVIDGSNVAMCHGRGKIFSCRGIKLVVDDFLQRGHTKITAVVPEWTKYKPRPQTPIVEEHLLAQMQEDGHLVFTPSKRIDLPERFVLELAEREEGIIVFNLCRRVLELAEREKGIVVSNNEYKDLVREKYSWRKMIEERLLMFVFVGDHFMPPYDPLGRYGPTLDQYLCMPENRKRHTIPYYQERNPYNNARNAGKRQRDNSKPRQPGHIFQRPPFHKQRSGRSKYPHRQYDNSHS